MAVSKRTRFEVFKRDGFKCQYCGKSAPDAVLEADHIDPRSKGGSDGIANLVTACRDCNAGKSNIKLDDSTAMAKERRQLEELNERREQLEMMLDWKKGLLNIDRDASNGAVEYFCMSFDCSANDIDAGVIHSAVKKYGFNEVIESIDAACNSYSDASHAIAKLPAILYVRKRSKNDPHYSTICLVKGRLKCRGFYVNERTASELIRGVLRLDKFTQDQLLAYIDKCKNWTEWRGGMEATIREFGGGDK